MSWELSAGGNVRGNIWGQNIHWTGQGNCPRVMSMGMSGELSRVMSGRGSACLRVGRGMPGKTSKEERPDPRAGLQVFTCSGCDLCQRG